MRTYSLSRFRLLRSLGSLVPVSRGSLGLLLIAFRDSPGCLRSPVVLFLNIWLLLLCSFVPSPKNPCKESLGQPLKQPYKAMFIRRTPKRKPSKGHKWERAMEMPRAPTACHFWSPCGAQCIPFSGSLGYRLIPVWASRHARSPCWSSCCNPWGSTDWLHAASSLRVELLPTPQREMIPKMEC